MLSGVPAPPVRFRSTAGGMRVTGSTTTSRGHKAVNDGLMGILGEVGRAHGTLSIHARKASGAIRRSGNRLPISSLIPRRPSRTSGVVSRHALFDTRDEAATTSGWERSCSHAGVRMKRRLKRSRCARPNIWRLSILRRLMCPSTGLVLHGRVTPASTAARAPPPPPRTPV
jgi:hypothetical protein